jgi:diamine N-acetyltransferase
MKTPNCKLPDPATLYKEAIHEDIPAYIQEAGNLLASGEAKACMSASIKASTKDVELSWGWIIAATAHM